MRPSWSYLISTEVLMEDLDFGILTERIPSRHCTSIWPLSACAGILNLFAK